MRHFEINIKDYKLTCGYFEEESVEGIEVLSVRGSGSSIEIPAFFELEGQQIPIVAIGKKAFLGNHTICEIFLPGTICFIGDWAFAQSTHLRLVSFTEKRDIVRTWGVGVFEDCPALCQIGMEKEEEISDLSVLWAASIVRLHAEDLLRSPDVGSMHWYQKWDLRLMTFLSEDDQEGYINMVLCGEEGLRKNQEDYMKEKRREKADLCLLRLLHPSHMDADSHNTFVEYLLSHKKGCPSEASWETIYMHHGDALAYFQLFADVGGVTKDNIDAMLMDLSSAHPEAKAFLIQYKQKMFENTDIFSGFEL